MARTVQCIKLGKEAEGLDFPPYPGELGKRIYDGVSKEAWAGWLKHQTMLVNENRLNLAESKADAEFDVAKARCEDQVGEAKDACRRNAKATRDKAKEQAKRDSQTDTRSPDASGATDAGTRYEAPAAQ